MQLQTTVIDETARMAHYIALAVVVLTLIIV